MAELNSGDEPGSRGLEDKGLTLARPNVGSLA